MKTLGARIRQRREELGYSQSYLASLLDYSDRSTIAKIEKGVNDVVQSKIVAFARALETTPGYLMGWTDDPYDYDEDPNNLVDTIPDTLRREWLDMGLTNAEMWQRYTAMQGDAHEESSKMEDEMLRAAFFNGLDPSLTPDDWNELWEDAKDFIRFQVDKRKRRSKNEQ